MCVWFIPIKPPIKALKIAHKKISDFRLLCPTVVKISKHSGPNFCHVQRINEFIQVIDTITDGNQKWQGAAPNLRINLRVRRAQARLDVPVVNIDILEYNISADPSACAKKYFTAASVSWFAPLYKIIGINDRRFTSIDSHAINQFELDKAINVLKTRNVEKIADDGNNINIRAWRSWTPY